MADVLAVGAHPDDIELGAGGIVASLIKQGKSVAVLDLTNGEPTPHGSPEIRKQETEKANEILKIDRRAQLDFKNRELMDTLEGRTKIAEQYRIVRPEVLLLPYREDAHPDHVQASDMALAARFIAKYTKTDMAGEPFYPRKVFFYFCTHLKTQLQPTMIFDISDTFELKIEALRAYHSQFFAAGGKRGEEFIARVTAQATFYGILISARYGEPLISCEQIGVRSFDSLLP